VTITEVGDGGVPWIVRTFIPPIVEGDVEHTLLTIPGGDVGRQFSARYAVGVVSPVRIGVGLRC
jgi:hypothetical protein